MRAEPIQENVTRFLDVATFVGVTTGLTLLICSFFFPGLKVLAVPGLILLLPSIVYGLR